jgi:multidrug resistance efflux pump
VVDALLVEEGQVVLAGQVLARLGGRKTAEGEITSAQRELAAAESALKSINDDAFLATAQALKDLRDLETAEKDAKKNLRDLQDNKESDDKIAQAEANLALVRARLEKAERIYEMLKNGPDAEKLAAAELRLKDAQAKLAAAQERLSALEILAPFNATVIKIDLAPGEYASPGAPAILLANTQKYQVETTDLSELNVLNIQPGEKAEVTFDAIPEQKFPGVVRSVQPLAETVLGETIFHAVIDGDFSGKGLMWGMTCSVVIGE